MNDIIAPGGGSARSSIVRIHEVGFPLATTDVDQLKEACLVPIYQPGVVNLGRQSGQVTDPSGRPAQVVVGHATGFNGGQALIIRETAAALDELRAQNKMLKKGLRVALEITAQLADEVMVGKDGQTSSRIREMREAVRSMSDVLPPSDV